MRQPLDRSIADVIVACMEYYCTNIRGRDLKKRSEPYKRVKNTLTATLKAMAALHAARYSGWNADPDHAGYLIKFEPPMFFRVPYHVVPSFPTDQELEALWHLSRTIRSGERSVISISGSNVMRNIFETVGDVDFCEYFPDSDTDGFGRIVANMDGNGRIVCVRLVLIDGKWKTTKEWLYPWGKDRPTRNFFETELRSSDGDRSTMKVDYVGDVDHIGVTEITNIIIVTDDDGKSASLSKTFAAQEAPLVLVDRLPNQMNDPIEMGRYGTWLAKAVETLSEKGDMRKCLKRCASLSRVLFAPDVTNEIADLASESTILLHDKLTELEKLSGILAQLTDARSRHLSARLERQSQDVATALEKRGGRPDEGAQKRFDEEAGRIASRLLSRVRPGYDPGSRRAA